MLGGAAISKVLFLLMTSQLSPDQHVTVCKGPSAYEPGDLERYSWIWALLIAYSIPEFGTFIRSARMWFFKGYVKEDLEPSTKGKKERFDPEKVEEKKFEPYYMTAIVIFLTETLSTIGMAIMVFEVLPNIDVVRGVMLTNCVCFVPGILSKLVMKGSGRHLGFTIIIFK